MPLPPASLPQTDLLAQEVEAEVEAEVEVEAEAEEEEYLPPLEEQQQYPLREEAHDSSEENPTISKEIVTMSNDS
jgi:hypothetical protein